MKKKNFNIFNEINVLDIFKESCEEELTDENFQEKLKQIKKFFIERDYLGIFNDKDLIKVYATSYSPSRALCWRNLFLNNEHLLKVITEKSCNCYLLGAGSGSELIGITAAYSEHLKVLKNESTDVDHLENVKTLSLNVQDLSDNRILLGKMEVSLRSKYSKVINDNNFKVEYSLGDILSQEIPNLQYLKSILENANLITAFFLLNELLSNSKLNFTKFIIFLVKHMKRGSHFLVVDSAGNFSDVQIGNVDAANKKKYMVYQLLDGIKDFEILTRCDSEWYRFPKELQFPLKLDNMRYFIRLYRKI
ncbi:hypothetical protein HK099_007885 [Clydaea vesicula]|uniref:Uncharacterized protein n=1 Tax=Clydaea vesicula TaxID=447962 RepID=A0AAD5TVY7_9FUNG|nr:hypothetical protein HK099_007885 [Clydaea vesicula]KAJ3380616.1 hypothetical protein HDU92_005869 [Lobulomyces angularis]